MALTIIFFLAAFGFCFLKVSSLDCYSCFSYESNVECENQHHLKKITCYEPFDTCVKYEMKILIAEAINGSSKLVLNSGYARYCGKKSDCQSYPQKCPHTFYPNDAQVTACNITCCDEDIDKSACHQTPHYPGDVRSTNIQTSNQTVGKGAPGDHGHGTQLRASVWFVLMNGALIWMSV